MNLTAECKAVDEDFEGGVDKRPLITRAEERSAAAHARLVSIEGRLEAIGIELESVGGRLMRLIAKLVTEGWLEAVEKQALTREVLAKHLDCNVKTLDRWVRELRHEGLLFTEPTRAPSRRGPGRIAGVRMRIRQQNEPTREHPHEPPHEDTHEPPHEPTHEPPHEPTHEDAHEGTHFEVTPYTHLRSSQSTTTTTTKEPIEIKPVVVVVGGGSTSIDAETVREQANRLLEVVPLQKRNDAIMTAVWQAAWGAMVLEGQWLVDELRSTLRRKQPDAVDAYLAGAMRNACEARDRKWHELRGRCPPVPPPKPKPTDHRPRSKECSRIKEFSITSL